MLADEFITILNKIRPTADQLKEVGCSQNTAERIASFYRCEKRAMKLLLSHSPTNELVELQASNDISSLEFGAISFLEQPKADSYGINFAQDESDPLYIAESGNIVLRQGHKLDFVISNVAKSSGHFLDMFITYIKYSRDVQLNVIDYKDMETAKKTADECTTKAGGEEYRNFCMALFGI